MSVRMLKKAGPKKGRHGDGAPKAEHRHIAGFLKEAGFTPRTDTDLVQIIRHGFPTLVIEILESWSVDRKEIDRLVIPLRTLQHRLKANQPLSPAESEKAYRVARIISQAEEVFGDREKADTWLRRPTRVLNGVAPLDIIDSETGARLVENLMIRIGHGMAA